MMSARDEIEEYYEEWRTLSDAEAPAIQQSKWAQMQQCQSRKAAIQKMIIQRTPAMEQELDVEDAAENQRELRIVISDLISMERRNGELLAEKRRCMSAEQDGLEKSNRNLSRIRQAYTSKPQTAWFSYS